MLSVALRYRRIYTAPNVMYHFFCFDGHKKKLLSLHIFNPVGKDTEGAGVEGVGTKVL